uniref:Putative retrotransposon gag domain, Thiamin diphosphate-binding fold protein n=1 Tax=Helianthus annuus TaxID=4232 RepID=A0A251UXQ2_HELAN
MWALLVVCSLKWKRRTRGFQILCIWVKPRDFQILCLRQAEFFFLNFFILVTYKYILRNLDFRFTFQVLQMTVRDALNSALNEEMAADPNVFVMDEEVVRNMSGRGHGRGHIAMTQAELTILINTRVAEALAAYQAGQPANQNNPPAPPACTYKMFMDCKPQTFSGTEGAVGLLVKYATGTLEDGALTWWNAQVQMLGIEMANATTWDDFKELMREEYCPRDEIQKLENEFYNLKMEGSEIEAYTRRSNDLATLCPNMSRPPPRRIELYLKGLAPAVKGYVTAANLDNLPRIVRLAHKITDQEVERGNLPPRVSATTSTATATTPASDNKRKWNDTDKATGSVLYWGIINIVINITSGINFNGLTTYLVNNVFVKL